MDDQHKREGKEKQKKRFVKERTSEIVKGHCILSNFTYNTDKSV